MIEFQATLRTDHDQNSLNLNKIGDVRIDMASKRSMSMFVKIKRVPVTPCKTNNTIQHNGIE